MADVSSPETPVPTNQCYVYFAFVGEDFDPDAITERLEVQPTSIRRKGERAPGRVPRYDAWQISTPEVVSEVIDVARMASELIAPLRGKVEQINALREDLRASTHLEIVLTVVTDDRQSTPALGLAAETIEFLAKVGAYLDVDLYRG